MADAFKMAAHLGRWHDREGEHDSVWVLLPDLADEQGAHARPGAPPEGVGQLEALKAVAALRLLANHVEHRVDQLSTLCAFNSS